MHFLIKLYKNMDFETYFRIVKMLKEYGESNNLIIDEFGDCCEQDARVYRKEADKGKLNYLEGTVSFNEGTNVNQKPEIYKLLNDFFTKEKLADMIASIEI